MTPTELWYKENRHFLLLVILQVAAVVLLVFVVVPLGDRALSLWRDTLNPEIAPSETDLRNQIAFWERANGRLSAQLDSAATLSRESGSQEKQLATIQTTITACKLSLISCDVRPLSDGNGFSETAYDLQIRGSFRNLGKLITELESSPKAAVVDKMSLEGKESGASIINASVTLILNGRRQP